MIAVVNMLAAANPIEHIIDAPWRIGGVQINWMSSHIAVMILAALILLVSMLVLAARNVPHARRRSMGLVEMVVLFVRKNITGPTMDGKMADKALPFIATLFMFLLLCNLLGLVPLLDISIAAGLTGWGGVDAHGVALNSTPIGGTPTSGMWVTVPYAVMVLCIVIFGSYFSQLRRLWKGKPAAPALEHDQSSAHEHAVVPAGVNIWMGLAQAIEKRRWPLPVAAVLAVYTWLNSFVPAIPGAFGLVLWPMLLVIEFAGSIARCLALAIRLLANMTSGHMLLIVLLGFAQATRSWLIPTMGLPIGLAVIALMLLELLIAAIQAYVFAILASLYISLAANPRH